MWFDKQMPPVPRPQLGRKAATVLVLMMTAAFYAQSIWFNLKPLSLVDTLGNYLLPLALVAIGLAGERWGRAPVATDYMPGWAGASRAQWHYLASVLLGWAAFLAMVSIGKGQAAWRLAVFFLPALAVFAAYGKFWQKLAPNVTANELFSSSRTLQLVAVGYYGLLPLSMIAVAVFNIRIHLSPMAILFLWFAPFVGLILYAHKKLWDSIGQHRL